MKIESLTDAATVVENSGVRDWEWGGNASLDGLTEYVFRNCAHDGEFQGALRDYLISVGENPQDYDLDETCYRAAVWTSDDGQSEARLTTEDQAHMDDDALLEAARKELTDQGGTEKGGEIKIVNWKD